MSPAVLKELQLQANYPRGIAARVDSADLKQLLEERVELLALAKHVRDCADEEEEYDLTRVWAAIAKADAP